MQRSKPQEDVFTRRSKGELFVTGAFAAIFIITLTILFGCSGDGLGLNASGDLQTVSSEVVSFSEDIQPIFNANCTRCHAQGGIGYLATGGEDADGLDLSQASSHAGLVGVRTFEEPQLIPRWRVMIGEPDSSYLLEKVSSGSQKSGSRMPSDGPPFLTDGEIQRIERWIEEGAEDN
jgi:hypothetical protein